MKTSDTIGLAADSKRHGQAGEKKMRTRSSTAAVRAFFATAALATACAGWGCVADRPARNGVFDENQYLRKAFIVQSGNGSAADTGWMLNATVTQVSTPNPFGGFGIFPGAESGGSLVRFAITSDKLQMIDMRAMSQDPSGEVTTTPSIVNAWPITNVDLKYEVNLDGEKTNFYSENQELDWQVRQWVKLTFDKNDLSDLAPLGSATAAFLAQCTDPSAYSTTLVPNSFLVDETNNYLEWSVQVTMPINWIDATCVTAYGALGQEATTGGPTVSIPRQAETITLKYSMTRANPKPTYQPLIVAEKDPIRHKYRAFEFIAENRDPNSGLLAAQQMVERFDPNKPIVWYFTQGFPTQYMTYFTCQGTVPGSSPVQQMADLCGKMGTSEAQTLEAQTNQLMTDAGAASRVSFLNYNDQATFGDGAGPNRQYGDVRYSFFQWLSDKDIQDGFAGVTQFITDPRTGETLSAQITINDFEIKSLYVQRIDAYLQSIGASLNINSAGEWSTPPGTCKQGQTMPIVPATVAANHNGTDSLYNKIQLYLQKDPATYGNLGPQDFIIQQDADFFNAYYKILPYEVYNDPDMNPFVIREGGSGVLGPASVWPMMQQEAQFQKLSAQIDQGLPPYDGSDDGPVGYQNAVNFLNNYKALSLNHQQLSYVQGFMNHGLSMDPPGAFSFESVIAKDARQCILNDPSNTAGGTHWETKAEWTNSLIYTYWGQTMWHEFGHSLGLRHNFMGNLDQYNFPTYTDPSGTHVSLYSNSVMEYNATPDRIFWHQTWGPQDKGAISWIYGNAKSPSDLGSGLNNNTGPYGAAGTNLTGQASATAPWRDPNGFCQAADVTAQNPQCPTVGVEKQFLQCTDEDMKYSPFCQQGDIGTTPSAIIANQIDSYEWQYAWRNYRAYLKVWDNSAYANAPMGLVTATRRFLSTWIYDWDASDLVNNFRRLGITDPDPNGAAVEYYTQLTNKFNSDVSMANQLVGAFHKAIINESSGDRPYRTIYDQFYGDVTQQGIILDKLDAMQSWVALWPTLNYDQNQAGNYISSYGVAAALGDPSYEAIAEDAVNSMIGGQYDVYPYFVPLAVSQFATDTHSPSFNGRIEIRNWIGGQVFYRLEDFLAYFRDKAAQNNLPGCATAASCTYDPRPLSDTHNQFFGPDDTLWIWAYIPDRNQWVAAQKEYNTASYVIIRNYTDDVIFQLDDGNQPGGAFNAELPMKYFLDSFTQAN